MTEDEAKKKLCPVMTRPDNGILREVTCKGSECVMWTHIYEYRSDAGILVTMERRKIVGGFCQMKGNQ